MSEQEPDQPGEIKSDGPYTPAPPGAPADGLSPDAAYLEKLSEVNRMDVIDLAVRAKRLPNAPYATVIGSCGFTFLGAGLGAWIAGAKGTSAGVIAGIGIGIALLLGAVLVRLQRSESVSYFCADFLEYIDRWPPLSGHQRNSDYVRGRARAHEPGWIKERWRERRASQPDAKKLEAAK